MNVKTGLIVVAALLVIASMLAMVGIVAAQAEPISGQVDKYNAQGQIVELWLISNDINSSDYVTVHITDGVPFPDYYNFSDISPLLSRNGYSVGNTYNVTVTMFCNGYEWDINGTPGAEYNNTYQNDTETNGTFVFDNSLKTLPMMNLTLCPTPTPKPTDLHQEVGDAIYCDVPNVGLFIEHAGIYYTYTGGNPNDFNNHLMFDQVGEGSRLDTLQKFKGDREYFGSYTVKNGLDKVTRWKIVNTALALKNASKPYVHWTKFISKPVVPDWSDNYWNGTVEDIAGFRCDGYVEYAYEKNGVRVLQGFIDRPVRRSRAFVLPDLLPPFYAFYCWDDFLCDSYCYSNQDLISHYGLIWGISLCTPTIQKKSLVRSIWEPPTQVSSLIYLIDLETRQVFFDWEKATDKHSGLWGYYYVWDNSPDTEPLPKSEWENWKKHYLGPNATSWESPKIEIGKLYWFHIRSVDKAGNMAEETTHEGPFIIDCSEDSDCKKCEECVKWEHEEIWECVPIIPCCGNRDCEKELGENEENCPQDCPPGPGNDHPDENHDVSISRITLDAHDSSTAPEIAILSSGLYGLDSLPSFKSNLEQYIKGGGTLIVFSQQHGYEFNVVPGDLGGYGWTEDQSCHHSSVGISTYHPILSGQDSVTSDVTVDGYFTKYPENATILLSRTKNGMPAMLMYEYGNGTVIASTIYTDWAYTHYQATRDGKNIVRDMIAWAKDMMEISEYGRTDIVTIRINRTIPKPDLLPEYTDYELGAVVNVPVNITNPFNVTVDNVSFSLYDPDMEIDYVNVSITIPPNETRTVDFTYADTDKDGFYFVLYSLCIGEACVEIGDLAYFFGIDVTITPSYRVNYVLLDPDKNIITNESVVFDENVSVIELPKNVSILNLSYENPSKLGIWRFEYEIFDVNNYSVESGVKKFAVSEYAENPDGWVYQEGEITFGVNSESENYAYGSKGVFTINIWNHGDTDRNITFRGRHFHHYGVGLPKTSLVVPSNGGNSFIYTLDNVSHEDWLVVYFYDEEGNKLGTASNGFYVFHPSVGIGIETDQKEYAKGEDVFVSLNLTNKQKISHNVTVIVRTLDPDNKKIYEDRFDANLSAGASANKTLDFTLPADSRVGTYIVTAEAYEKGNKIGSNSAYFEISTSYLLRLNFDKPDKVYCIRQNLSLSLNVSNTGSSVWTSWINTTIPSLSFSDSKFLSLNPNESEEIEYKNLGIPTDLAPGKHNVLVNLSYDSSTTKDNFFIPCSDLRIEAGKKYNAGENLRFNISNVGGVDTTFNCSFKLVDWKGKLMYEDMVEDAVLSLNSKTISSDIHNQSVNGSYYLLVSCKDIKTGKETELAALCDVSGLKADLTSDTERKVYFENENVSIITNITNRDGEIENGTLNLKIVRVSIPHSTGQALARATARAASTPANLTPTPEHEHEPENETGELPIEELSPIPSINVTPTPEHEPLAPPADEFNESYDNESRIEEFVPSPSPSPLPVNLTPIPEPEPEEELNETYKPITAKLSSLEIGNETVWKDEVKILNENLIVNSTGNLTLINTTLIMNCSSDGQYHIEVQNGGEMHIFDSNITASDSRFEYYFQVNSSSKFEMRDSELSECGHTWGTNGDHAGLWINTDNTTIENNEFTRNYNGIVFYHSSNNTIKNNSVHSNLNHGVYLYGSSNNNRITGNHASSNHCGIFPSGSSNNNITGNNASSNDYGIFLSSSSNNNMITGNNASSNSRIGIYLSGSSNNNITSNNAFSNTNHGIYLSGSSNNNITSNNAYSNFYGIYLDASSNNNITGNNASSNDQGIFLSSSSNNNMSNNNITGNNVSSKWHGIYLYDSSNNNITGNNASSNDYGIHLADSSNNNITGNNASSNFYYGISLDRSSNNNITGNNASSNSYGISLDSSSNNNITGNNASSNYNGIYLSGTSNNNITGNNAFSNTNHGIYLSGAFICMARTTT
jgi:parallel beta-helix repeat protein